MGKYANTGEKVTVEAVYSTEESLGKGLELRAVGNAHPQASQAIEEGEAGIFDTQLTGQTDRSLWI